MSAVFRKLNKKRHWDSKPWLESRDVQADVAKCLTTTENKLFIFLLEKPNEQVERVVAALALTRDNLACFDLAIVSEDILSQCNIQLNKIKAKTLDAEVNEWHYDLVELTIGKVSQLASSIKCRGEIQRYQEKQVRLAIKKSLDAHHIEVDRISPKMQESPRKRQVISL